MRKIVDILPPEKVSKISPEKSFKQKPHFHFIRVLVIVFVIFGLVSAILFFLNSKSKLTLYLEPKTELTKLDEEVEVNVSNEVVDFQNKVIPGRIFELEKEKSETFKPTGEDFEGKKAEGTIFVYNAQNPPRSIVLRPKTRFLSAEGEKIFKAPERIYLPPAKIKNGKLIPSLKKVKVVAQEVGEDYNIGPSKFSVPGLSGTSLYYSIWAESKEGMKGGFKKKVKKVLTKDLENAKKNLQDSLYSVLVNSLKSKIPEGYILENKAITKENQEVSCLAKPEDHVSEFNCKAKMEVKGFAFSSEDLKKLSISLISNEISSDENIYQKSLELKSLPLSLFPEEGKMILDLEIQGEIYKKVPKELILSKISGNSEDEIRKIVFENYPQTKILKIKFWPFWVKKAPEKVERIKLKLTF